MVGQVGHRLKALISSTMVKNLGKEEKKKKNHSLFPKDYLEVGKSKCILCIQEAND